MLFCDFCLGRLGPAKKLALYCTFFLLVSTYNEFMQSNSSDVLQGGCFGKKLCKTGNHLLSHFDSFLQFFAKYIPQNRQSVWDTDTFAIHRHIVIVFCQVAKPHVSTLLLVGSQSQVGLDDLLTSIYGLSNPS